MDEFNLNCCELPSFGDPFWPELKTIGRRILVAGCFLALAIVTVSTENRSEPSRSGTAPMQAAAMLID